MSQPQDTHMKSRSGNGTPEFARSPFARVAE
jgi:hypothetical protein